MRFWRNRTPQTEKQQSITLFLDLDMDMIMNTQLKDKITIIINSCDSYDDLWIPFFTLFKKYWNPEGFRILLNTESKDFSFDGLVIECVHPEKPEDPYGKRMLNVLSKVTTPYVIPLLDDYFIRKPVNISLIDNIIKWMDQDKRIAYFNCDCTPTYYDYEVDTYPGFKRLPRGNEYVLNMQTAVWRTKKLLKYWRPQVSPWEWELHTNIIAARSRYDKFYCVSDPKNGFCNYGYSFNGMGVYRGKWVKEDVVTLFQKENINVDFSKRGFLSSEEHPACDSLGIRNSLKTIESSSQLIERCLGHRYNIQFFCFVKRNQVLSISRYAPDYLFLKYTLAKEQKRFIKNIQIKKRFFSKHRH